MDTNKIRLNGFKMPFHLYQLSSWLYLVLCIAEYYIFLFPFRRDEDFYFLSSMFDFSLILVLFFGFLTTKSDPTDTLVRSSWNNAMQAGDSQCNYKCMICNAPIYRKSKHCMDCNRCTEDFDHHCKWLNNCIGRKNYRVFWALLLSFQINQATLLASSIIFTYYCIENPEKIEHLTKSAYHLDGYVSLVAINIIFSVFSAIIVFTNGYLICFHIFLKFKGVTTYEYIIYKNAMKKKKPCIRPEIDSKRF
ncbi:hypothetical protein SteCoe_4374 [Stentor coeruleus]|uniref:Palmitoyltransferase n=1 Tax=Stentor coeruleus TaxID=5963 RepID=A0A1R2CUQ3_9CILI|nr:hypothetical protein SteCoe_4374 [Stentor coeruleus]